VPPQRSPGPAVRGQAGVDYVGVLLLVTAVLGAVALVADGSGLPQAVDHQLLRALCVVRGGECEQDRAPCPVRSDRRDDAVSARILVFHVGADKTLIREERSDGTVAITVAYGEQGGLEVSAGAHLEVALGRGGLGMGGELTAAAVAARERGYTWVLRDGHAADALVRRLGVGPRKLDALVASGRVPAPAQRYRQGGVGSRGSASGGSVPGATLGLSSQDVAGTRTDASTGRRTLYVQRTVEGALSLTYATAGATVAHTTRERYAVTYDAAGRPVDLMVLATGIYRGSFDLPARLQPALGLLSAPTGHVRTYVEETHLDLTDPESLRVARDFLEQVRRPDVVHAGAAVAVAAALRRRLDAVAVVHARTYDADQRRYGIDGVVGVEGIQLGASLSRTLLDSHLVAAATRGLDGVWRVRRDCLART
jgi:YD repeat-containing protein